MWPISFAQEQKLLKSLAFIVFLIWSSPLKAGVLENDISQIFSRAGLRAKIDIQFRRAKINQVQFACPTRGKFLFRINSTKFEKASTLYWGIHQLGFLFPHPKQQISPAPNTIMQQCGKGWRFTPTLKRRGFHFHTQHPSEWVQAFFMGDTESAQDSIRWLARNFQNIMQVQMLRGATQPLSQILNNKSVRALLRAFQIRVGLGMSFSSIQQKSYYLIKPWLSFFKRSSLKQLFNSLNLLNTQFPHINIWTIELGTSEFTPTPYELTLMWIKEARRLAGHYKKELFIKVHASSGQVDEKYGNYNFLPQYADQRVGVLPHTTLFYGLTDLVFPMYGRSDLVDMKDFLLKQNRLRPTWYFPETSYFIGLDIDIPLFLTPYLTARSADMEFLSQSSGQGQLVFSTGQELGYWMFDWTAALLTVDTYKSDPMIGLKLIGESAEVWDPILEFQDLQFKRNQLIQQLSSSNLMDELPFTRPIHDRYLLRDLRNEPNQLNLEIRNLEKAIESRPDISGIRNEELRLLMQVTWLRMEHALHIRRALIPRHDDQNYTDLNEFVYRRDRPDTTKASSNPLSDAANIRGQAQAIMKQLHSKYNRYPESIVFKKASNPTSYQYGYAWPAKKLHYWQREEEIALKNISNPFFMNIYDIWDIIL